MPNQAYLHLMLNHLPIVGVPFCALLLAKALWFRNRDVNRIALAFCVLVALLTIPAFLTGKNAEGMVAELPGVEHDQIHEHEEWAERSLWLVEALGLGALVGLVLEFRRRQELPAPYLPVLLVLAVVATSVLVVAANQGGRIRHPELVPGFEAPSGEDHAAGADNTASRAL